MSHPRSGLTWREIFLLAHSRQSRQFNPRSLARVMEVVVVVLLSLSCLRSRMDDSRLQTIDARYVDTARSRVCFHNPRSRARHFFFREDLNRGYLDHAVAFVPPRHQASPRPGTGRPLRMCELVTGVAQLVVDAPLSLPCRACLAVYSSSSSFVPRLPLFTLQSLHHHHLLSLPPSPRSVSGQHPQSVKSSPATVGQTRFLEQGWCVGIARGGSFGVAKEQATWDDEPESCGGPEIRVCHARGEGEAVV